MQYAFFIFMIAFVDAKVTFFCDTPKDVECKKSRNKVFDHFAAQNDACCCRYKSV